MTRINMPSHGYFNLAIREASGTLRGVTNTVNTVTYEGAAEALFGKGMFQRMYCKVGTGTTEILRTDTGLNAPEGATSDNVGSSRQGNQVDNADGTTTITNTRELVFPVGSIIGTISEVGIYTRNADKFVAGQLIKDEFDEPTTVTLLEGEQLVVTYTLEWTVPNDSKLVGSGTVTDANSNNYSYEIYSQPYFREYDINDTGEVTRFGGSRQSAWGYGGSGGDSLLPKRGVNPSESRSGDVYTINFGEVVWPPTAGNGDVAAVTFSLAGNNYQTNHKVIDGATGLTDSGSQSGAVVAIMFRDKIPKTSERTFSLSAELSFKL